MNKNRLETFSDGVLAIIITIMVLELEIPESHDPMALLERWPIFISYLLSFACLGIYWNNHHHLLQATKRINGTILWANLHLLFWLSLVPFATGWLGHGFLYSLPAAFYGVIFLAAGIAYFILSRVITRQEKENALLKAWIGKDIKGFVSLVLYFLGIVVSFFVPLLSLGIYLVTSGIWLVPDRRIEGKYSELDMKKSR